MGTVTTITPVMVDSRLAKWYARDHRQSPARQSYRLSRVEGLGETTITEIQTSTLKVEELQRAINTDLTMLSGRTTYKIYGLGAEGALVSTHQVVATGTSATPPSETGGAPAHFTAMVRQIFETSLASHAKVFEEAMTLNERIAAERAIEREENFALRAEIVKLLLEKSKRQGLDEANDPEKLARAELWLAAVSALEAAPPVLGALMKQLKSVDVPLGKGSDPRSIPADQSKNRGILQRAVSTLSEDSLARLVNALLQDTDTSNRLAKALTEPEQAILKAALIEHRSKG